MKLLKKSIIIYIMGSMLLLGTTGCGSSGDNAGAAETQSKVVEGTEASAPDEAVSNDIFNESGISKFEISSEDLHDGVWDTIITNTEKGANVSPQLTWEAVPGAECYVIYMVDTTAGDWIHWKSNNVTENNIPQGWAPKGEYIGPYPPGGTHNYEIYVIAIKQPVERAKGAFNNSNLKFKENVLSLDEAVEGTSGNIISYGHISGTYTYGD